MAPPTILVVDDDVSVRTIVGAMLEPAGYAPVLASSAEEAIACLDDGLKPRLILSDIVMTGMTGLALLDYVREQHAEIPIVMVSGVSDVAVAIGADPATMYSAILPLPPDLDEMMIAGFLRQSPVEMVKCQTCDLEVPAHAEIVLEGYVELGELRTEGPFGDHTGFYSLADEYPVFHVTCMTHRKDPIYATTIVGPPPMEDYYMGKAIERIFLPLMRLQLPEVRDIAMPAEGVFHNLILVAIRKSYPGHARKVMHSIWGTGQAMFSKCIVVVDEDVDVQNYREVAWKALNNIDPERDIQFVMGPVDSLDHASRLPNYGSKMGIDATRKWPGEGFTRPWPGVIGIPADVKERVDALWKRAGL